MRITCRADRWLAPPGSTVMVEEMDGNLAAGDYQLGVVLADIVHHAAVLGLRVCMFFAAVIVTLLLLADGR